MGNGLCTHTHSLGTRLTLICSLRHESNHEDVCMQQAFTCRQRTGKDWHRMTSSLSFFCCMALGSLHKLFPKSSGRKCASPSFAVDMQNYQPAWISFILLGKLGTRQLSQTLSKSSGRKCASTSLRKLDSFLLLGKLGTRQLSQTLSISLGRECASPSQRISATRQTRH